VFLTNSLVDSDLRFYSCRNRIKDGSGPRTGSDLFKTGIRRITGTSLLVRVTNNLEEGAEHISRWMIVKVICFQHPEETKWNNVNSKIIL